MFQLDACLAQAVNWAFTDSEGRKNTIVMHKILKIDCQRLYLNCNVYIKNVFSLNKITSITYKSIVYILLMYISHGFSEDFENLNGL